MNFMFIKSGRLLDLLNNCYIYKRAVLHKGCPESIQPFWISREPVAWHWC